MRPSPTLLPLLAALSGCADHATTVASEARARVVTASAGVVAPPWQVSETNLPLKPAGAALAAAGRRHVLTTGRAQALEPSMARSTAPKLDLDTAFARARPGAPTVAHDPGSQQDDPEQAERKAWERYCAGETLTQSEQRVLDRTPPPADLIKASCQIPK